jgi:hypothetical protein
VTTGPAWSGTHRLGVAAGVVCVLAFLCWRVPDPGDRAIVEYALVASLGYGHLLGAWLFSSSDAARHPAGVSPALFRLFTLASVATAFALYESALRALPALYLPLLAASVWHVVENDLAMARAEGRSLRPLPSRPQLLALLLSAGVLVVGLGLLAREQGADQWLRALGAAELSAAAGIAGASLPIPVRGLAFADFYSAVILYHLFAWLVFLLARQRAEGRSLRPFALRLLWIHVPPVVAAAVLLAAGSRSGLLFQLFFSPAIYLFWSLLHVLHTFALRCLPAGAASDGVRAEGVSP